MARKDDQETVAQTRNVPRFFVEHPQVSWVLLAGVLVWGWFGYKSMPQRKDPDIPVRVAVAGVSGESGEGIWFISRLGTCLGSRQRERE